MGTPVKHELVVGQRFGKWTVTEVGLRNKPCPSDRNGRRAVRVQCECGVQRVVGIHPLVAGISTSCGCKRIETWADKGRTRRGRTHTYRPGEVAVGQVFGLLTVVETGYRKPITPGLIRHGVHRGEQAAMVVCICGKGPYLAACKNLREGTQRSCGCRGTTSRYLVRTYGGPWRKLAQKHGTDLCRCAADAPVPCWVFVERPEDPEPMIFSWEIECGCGKTWDLEIFDRVTGDTFTAWVITREDHVFQSSQPLYAGRRA